MRLRKLGRTGLLVSEIGFGASGLRLSSTEYAVQMVHRALELGVNYIDTASAYGDSEDKLGIALEGRRQNVFLATKLDAVTAKDAENEFHGCLQRLRTDYVDVLHMHGVLDVEDLDRRMASGGVWSFLRRAKKEGRTRFIGLSAHRHEVLVEAMRRDEVDVVLLIMNLVEREAANELIPMALEQGVGTTVMKPLAMGSLPYRPALRFLLDQPVSCVLPGPTRLEWLESNLEVAEIPLPLSENELAEIERLRQLHDGSRCRLCFRCRPCPAGVNIGFILGTYRFFSDVRNMKREGLSSFPWGDWARRNAPLELARIVDSIDRCDGCGQCESRCPYGLPIVQLLKDMLPALREMRELVSAW